MQLQETIIKWRNDIYSFVTECLGATPTEQQASALRVIQTQNSRVSIRSGHGTGKTTLLSWIIIWHTLLFQDAITVCTAPTARQLTDLLWGELKRWHSKMLPQFAGQLDINANYLRNLHNPEKRFATYRTARLGCDDALQGYHAENMIFIIDEASGVQDGIYSTVQGTMTTGNSRFILTGNPVRTAGFFYRSHLDGSIFDRIVFNGEKSTNVSKKYIEDLQKEYGIDSDMYRVRVLGEFPINGLRQLIPAEIIYNAVATQEDVPNLDAACILGVDVSYFGDDRSVIFKRQGAHAEMVMLKRDIDTYSLASEAARLGNYYRADAIFVDTTGVGAGCYDTLDRIYNGDAYPVMFAGRAQPLGQVQFFNKRAECWYRMAEWLKNGGKIAGMDERDIEEFSAPEYQISTKGSVQLEKKADIKARIGKSPDAADALALTFSMQIYKNNNKVLDKRSNFCKDIDIDDLLTI